MFRMVFRQVSLNMVPLQRRQILAPEGSNWSIIGRRAERRTDSSMRSSSRSCVEARSNTASGVRRTRSDDELRCDNVEIGIGGDKNPWLNGKTRRRDTRNIIVTFEVRNSSKTTDLVLTLLLML